MCLFIPRPKLPQQGLVIVTIEAPLALLQTPISVFGLDPVELAQVPLRLVPEGLNAIAMLVVVGKATGMVDPQMVKITDVPRIISPKGIRVHDAVRLHVLPNNGQAAVRVSSEDNPGVDFTLSLQQTKDHDLAGSAPFPSCDHHGEKRRGTAAA